MSQTSPGYSPTLIKQKKVPINMGPKMNRFRDIHLRSCAGILWVLHKIFEWMWEWICLFPADVALCAKLFGYMTVDDSDRIDFLIDALPHVHCHWHNRRSSECLQSHKTCSLWPPSWIKYKHTLQLFELSTSSDGLYGSVVCSRDTAYAQLTHWIRVVAYPYVR